MILSEQRVERLILEAQKKGEFDSLPGSGAPLVLDDDSAVPEELRMAYRILRNSGYLPPELQSRQEALELYKLMQSITLDDPRYSQAEKRLKLLEHRLQQAGLSTDFLQGPYKTVISKKLNTET
ncbi:DUF1992 domain-containing protein [Rouxiella sp. Mn2063]|uniref:DnaJ family domain-containing protein n=1 Tax=Rouxiella sp. Mn2063 TaxID=3395262 RepID=UPI003BD7F929